MNRVRPGVPVGVAAHLGEETRTRFLDPLPAAACAPEQQKRTCTAGAWGDWTKMGGAVTTLTTFTSCTTGARVDGTSVREESAHCGTLKTCVQWLALQQCVHPCSRGLTGFVSRRYENTNGGDREPNGRAHGIPNRRAHTPWL